MEILEAETKDAAEILALVHLAFADVAAEYGVESLPPLDETLPDLLAEFQTHTILKAVEGRRIVGSVRGTLYRGTCEIGRLVVRPDAQGRGIGIALTREIERRFPRAERFEAFTGHRSGASQRIFSRLGYVPFRVEPVSDSLQLVYLEKPGPAVQVDPRQRRR
jgi:GNAT superfamily N-acetyltransferase